MFNRMPQPRANEGSLPKPLQLPAQGGEPRPTPAFKGISGIKQATNVALCASAGVCETGQVVQDIYAKCFSSYAKFVS